MSKKPELSAVDYYRQLTPKQVQTLCGVSGTTFWKWVRAGKLTVRYVGEHQPRVRLGEVIELLEAQPVGKAGMRGLRGRLPDEFVPELGEKRDRKAVSVWERLGLKPKAA
jgi:predicted DNA-binding transcriptional regulator AlpA